MTFPHFIRKLFFIFIFLKSDFDDLWNIPPTLAEDILKEPKGSKVFKSFADIHIFKPPKSDNNNNKDSNRMPKLGLNNVNYG